MNVPKLRFKEFDGEWEEKKLEEISEKLTRKNKELKVTNVISNSASQGLVSQRAYFEKDIANKDNIDGYYIISKGDFVYNPRISKEAPYGPISIYHDNEDGIVSPLYTCFRILKESAFPIYLYYFFKSTSWHKYIYKNGDSGARHDRVSIKDATFFKLPVKLSTLEEQKKIGTFFEVMDKKIQLQQQKIDLLQEQKKGFLQKMFPKAGEKQPQVRFAGFTDDWGQRNIKEISKVFIGLVTSMTENYRDEGTLLIRNSDIKPGRLEFADNPIHLDEKFAEKNATRRLQIGDVVTVHTGDIGTSAVIGERENGAIGFATINTRPDTSVLDSAYLNNYFNTTYHKNWAIKMSTGDGRSNYNLYDFNRLMIPLPRLEEQKKIGAFINKLDDTIALHQQKLDFYKEQKKGFMQQMFI